MERAMEPWGSSLLRTSSDDNALASLRANTQARAAWTHE